MVVCLLRDVDGGWNLRFGHFGGERIVGVGVCGVVSSRFLAFFGGFCVGIGGEGW